jgi:hypothetical protein
MDTDETAANLWATCRDWCILAERFQQIADEGIPDGSRAQLDNAVAPDVNPPPAISHYLQERAWNTARMLRALHRCAFDTEAGRLHLDATVMYPLIRAALEDTATIVWLQEPSTREERLVRALRALHQDAVYFSKNHLILATATAGLGGDSSEQATALSKHIGVCPRDG